MDLLLCLDKIISDFRPLFNQQNFMLFQGFIFGTSQMGVVAPSQVFINRVAHRQDIGLLPSSFRVANGMQILSQNM